ncbi:MAG: DNA internalization-related competence protein ComEC/Rec2 [Noviherbaspirillum sp.]
MRSGIIGFVVGVCWLQTQAALPDWYLLGLSLACALLLGLMAARAVAAAVARPVLFAACGALLGFAWAALLAQHVLARELPRELEGQDVSIVGVIDSLPAHFDGGVRFYFRVERVLRESEGEDMDMSGMPGRLALSWYGQDGRGGMTGGVPALAPGERWQLTVRLRRPHGNANPHGFDYEAWLLAQGLRATGSVRPEHGSGMANRRLDAFVPGFFVAVERCRGWLRDRILGALPGKRYAGVLVALVVGEQREIGQSDWKVFNRTGTGHLVSISGLHITMVAGLFAALAQALWRRSFFTGAQLPLLLPAQKAGAAAGLAMALLYVLLAGFGVPARRTLYMLAVVAAALWLGRIARVSHVLCLALAAVVLFDPWAVLWPGFWLSFAAVAAILYATAGRAGKVQAGGGWRAALAGAARTQYAVTLGLAPLTVLLFGQLSLVGPLANALAIPVVSFAVTPLALAGSVLPPPLSGWALIAAHFLVEALGAVLEWMSAWPAAVWNAPVPPWWMFGLALAGTAWLLAPRGWPVRWLGMAAWLPLLSNPVTAPRQGFQAVVFDVGQGTAVLVETARHRLLYDTGPTYTPQADGGNRVILPYFRGRGIGALDAMLVSHSDSDHAGGALSILGEMPVGWVASSLPPGHAIARAAPVHRHCAAGQEWEWDGVRFEILHPAPDSYGNPRLAPNARSCTLKVSYGSHALLLPGDIEAAQEAQLLARQRDRLPSTVLVAPHHGSGTSSGPAFLAGVGPQLALFQVGYRNRYRHPKPEVFERYGRLGIARLRSDEAGAVSLRFDGALEYSAYRVTDARYWFGR